MISFFCVSSPSFFPSGPLFHHSVPSLLLPLHFIHPVFVLFFYSLRHSAVHFQHFILRFILLIPTSSFSFIPSFCFPLHISTFHPICHLTIPSLHFPLHLFTFHSIFLLSTLSFHFPLHLFTSHSILSLLTSFLHSPIHLFISHFIIPVLSCCLPFTA